MKWMDLRHAYYLKSSDFMAMLSILHVLMLTLIGFGVLRVSFDIGEIQDNAWALIVSTALFTTCLAGSRRKNDNTYGKFHKWFLPLVLFISLVMMITLSAYHGIITVLALHLVLISFSLTGFPCVFLILINLVGISFGTGFHVILVRRLYSKLADDEVVNKYPDLITTYGYGLATKSSIVLVDMAILYLQVLGGILFYSRFWKLGLLMSEWRSKPSYYLNDFPFLIKLEKLIFGKSLFMESKEIKILEKTKVTDPIHKSHRPDFDTKSPNSPVPKNKILSSPVKRKNLSSPSKDKNLEYDEPTLSWGVIKEQDEDLDSSKKLNLNLTNTTTNTSVNILNSLTTTTNTDTPNPFSNSPKNVKNVREYNSYVTEELNDEVWMNFLRESEGEPSGNRTYSQEKIILNNQISNQKTIEEFDESLIKKFTKNLLENEEAMSHLGDPLLNDELTLIKNVGTQDNLHSKLVQQSDDSSEREFTYEHKRIETAPFHYKHLDSDFNSQLSYNMTSINSLDNVLVTDKILNMNIQINSPLLKMTYLIMPSFVKKLMRKMFLHHERVLRKQEVINSLRWSGPESLPRWNFLHMFSHDPYELIYVKWMHCFNKSFYSITMVEIILIIFYSLIGSSLLCYRHYLTLSKVDKELFVSNIKGLITISLRFILFPIISFFIIIIILSMGTPSITQTKAKMKKSSSNSETKGLDTTQTKGIGTLNTKGMETVKSKGLEKVVKIYWIMIVLCLVDFIGSLFDVFISLGLKTPPYPVHNSLVMQFLMTKTAAFLPLRFPTLFLLYIVYFIGLFTCQFFFHHIQALRYITMQVTCQIVIGIGSYAFLIKPIDVNRRRIFSEVVLPYVLLLLSKFHKKYKPVHY